MIKKDGNKMSAAIKMLKGSFDPFAQTLHITQRDPIAVDSLCENTN